MSLRLRRLTAPGRGGVAVLALEGAGALAALERLTGRRAPPAGRPSLARLCVAGRALEEALVLVDGPERVELHLHGSPPLLAAVAEELGCQLPAAGEPPSGEHRPDVRGPDVRRPGEHPTLEARARAALARAGSEAGARVLLDQAEGALGRELARLAALAAAEPAAAREGLGALVRLGRALDPLLRVPRVVLAGPVNAGKSTLFNLLVGRRRVVTSERPGTTRDAIAERARLGALVVELVDTAGLRAAGSGPEAELESAGQALGRALWSGADLVLWLEPAGSVDAGGTPGGEDLLEPGGELRRAPVVVLASQAAAVPPGVRGPHHLAALEEPARAAAVVERAVALGLRLSAKPWVPGRAVPFERPLTEALAALARGPEEDLGPGLEALLR